MKPVIPFRTFPYYTKYWSIITLYNSVLYSSFFLWPFYRYYFSIKLGNNPINYELLFVVWYFVGTKQYHTDPCAYTWVSYFILLVLPRNSSLTNPYKFWFIIQYSDPFFKQIYRSTNKCLSQWHKNKCLLMTTTQKTKSADNITTAFFFCNRIKLTGFGSKVKVLTLNIDEWLYRIYHVPFLKSLKLRILKTRSLPQLSIAIQKEQKSQWLWFSCYIFLY